MQQLGLATKYIHDKKVRLAFKYLKFLAFLPVKDVIASFVKIAEKAPSCFGPFLAYFEKTFIGKKVRGRPNMRRRPLFEIEIWNCYDRVVVEGGRTNNSIEAWHKVFEVK